MLITSELTNQSARKALFTCVVYTNTNYDSFQIQEITKDSESGLMTVHALKNKQDKVALSGFDCIILAIGRGPNTDILGLGGLVCCQLKMF